jgi:hypothetical protein
MTACIYHYRLSHLLFVRIPDYFTSFYAEKTATGYSLLVIRR